MSIRIKLLLPTLLSFLLLSGLVHFVWSPERVNVTRERFIEHQKELLNDLESKLVQLLLSGDFAEMYASLNELMGKRSGTWKQITVHNAEGKRLFPLSKPKPVTSHSLAVLEQSLRYGIEEVGTLRGIFDWSAAFREAQAETLWIEAQVISVFALLSIMGFIIQSYWIRRPLRQLEQAAAELAINRFDAKLPAVSSDEIGSLTRAFNTMRHNLLHSQKELVLRKEQAETANRAKSAFLANMSHELRTPLNAVLGFAQILQRDSTLSPAQQENVNTIKRSGDYLLTLINDILDLAKIEAGRLELTPGPCELQRFFSELGNLFRLRAQEKGIAFQYQTIGTLPYSVEVDEKRLRQICMNLLGNAVKFTEQGEVQLTVNYQLTFCSHSPTTFASTETTQRPPHGELVIQVTDTGIGIPISEHKVIFQPFRQIGKTQYKQQGTGLGLTISHSLVKEMGGHFELDSQVGVGSRFTVRIPALQLKTVSEAKKAAKPVVVQGYRRTDGLDKPLQVLIVDDNLVNRQVICDLLVPLGFGLSEAEDGLQAVALSRSQHYDVILMDLVMPNLNGLEATRQILAQPDNSNKPIVALTACAFDEDRAKCMAAGCCDYLSKPLDSVVLLQILQMHLPLEWITPQQCQAAASDSLESNVAEGSEKSSLIQLEPEWLDTLEQAVICGRQKQANKLLEVVKTQDAQLAASLTNWIEHYDYKRVLNWIAARKQEQ